MNFGLIGFNKFEILETLSRNLISQGDSVYQIDLSELPGKSKCIMDGENVLFNNIKLNELDLIFLYDYRFFWPHFRFLHNSQEFWNSLLKKSISDEFTNFRESESIRQAVAFILDSKRKVINNLKFQFLFQFKFFLWNLLHRNSVRVLPFSVEITELQTRNLFLACDRNTGDNLPRKIKEALPLFSYPKFFLDDITEECITFFLFGDKIISPGNREGGRAYD
ncbi:MAG TPA: hypothetical protein ENN73_01775, partial [Firmicutes bacterium]|nr:hypothetical protein [Bacillota bacterium]